MNSAQRLCHSRPLCLKGPPKFTWEVPAALPRAHAPPHRTHLPIIIGVQVTTDGQHGASQAEALGCCAKGIWRLVNKAGIEVEGRGAGARVEGVHLETEKGGN